MLVKILGIFDIISAILFWIFGFFDTIPKTVILFVAFYLLIKGAIFMLFRDVISVGDIICSGMIFLSLIIMLPKAVIFLVAIFLLQKGIVSLF